jgi:hypothetical protein
VIVVARRIPFGRNTDRNGEPGHGMGILGVTKRRCFRMVYSRPPATHCRQPPAWREVNGSLLGRVTRSVATIRARRDMDEVTGLDRFQPVPDSAWHHVRVARSQQNLRLDADRPLVTVVKYQFHCSSHDVEELVTVRVDLTIMWSRSIDVGNRSDCVSIDSPWRSRRSRCDGHRPVPTDVRNISLEVDRRRVRGT